MVDKLDIENNIDCGSTRSAMSRKYKKQFYIKYILQRTLSYCKTDILIK